DVGNNTAMFIVVGIEDQRAGRCLELSFWLRDTLDDSIKQRLIGWETAPGARLCHPREEHLLPLHVCFGIAGRGADEVISVQALNKRASNYLWLN
ncbi:MAG: hypothetical protein ACO38G_06460, partial [Burkholderiaceae bacterium]